VKQCYINIES